HSPLVQVMFSLQNMPLELAELAGMRIEPIRYEENEGEGVARFDLTLSMTETPSGLMGDLEYNTDLFDRETVRRLLECYQRLLVEVVADPEAGVMSYELISQQEKRRQLVEWNATAVEFPQEKCIHELFEEQARRAPDALAVVHDDTELTYRQLNERSNRLAHYLRQQGVGPDQVVAICVARNPEMVVGLLAILKAGGAYVPLDPTGYPRQRLRYVLSDSRPVVLLIDEAGRSALSGELPLVPVIDLQADAGRWSDCSSQNPPAAAVGLRTDHLAYVIYTSGSTGQPKGVMIEHRSLVNYVSWALADYSPRLGAVVPVNTSISFDATATSLMTALCCGGHLYLLPEGSGELPVLGKWLAGRPRCSLVKLTPAHLEGLTRLSEEVAVDGAADALIIGGEALAAHQVQLWRERTPGTRLINEYGPTETTVGVVKYEISNETPAGGAIPIGRPIANTRIYLLDRQQRLTPIGALGEIYIGGAGVARGYRNHPDRTAERFLPDPFSADQHRRMYRTGDLGRWRADGVLEYLGRNDEQVKIRGYRIELGEIEAQLMCHPHVQAAVVLAREGATYTSHGVGREAGPWADGERAGRAQPDVAGEKRLVAYYTTVASQELEANGLRAHLRDRLPAYMVPAAYVRLEALPLTPNGKVDRRALPAPEWEANSHREYEAPRGELEQALAAVWAGLLGLERVGRQDNFFELGGHSLLAVTLVERMRGQGLRLDVRALFEKPTLCQLAESVRVSDA